MSPATLSLPPPTVRATLVTSGQAEPGWGKGSSLEPDQGVLVEWKRTVDAENTGYSSTPPPDFQGWTTFRFVNSVNLYSFYFSRRFKEAFQSTYI